MQEQPIIIYGVGKQAEQIAYGLSYYKTAEKVVAFTIEEEYYDKSELLDLPVLPFEEIEELLPPSSYKMLIAIGTHRVNRERERIYKEAKAKGYSLINFLCAENNAMVYEAEIGDNVIINDCKLSPFVEIGNNVILQGVTIGHHTEVKDHVLMSACTIGASVVIERNTIVGVGAIVASGVHIGEYSIIDTGAVITKDVAPYSIYTNNSSTVKRKVNSLRLQ